MASAIERGKAGTGAVLALSAIGKQDTFLTGTEKTFFKKNVEKHTNFATTFTSHIMNTNDEVSWPFGKTISFKIDPKESADILTNAFLKCSLPKPHESSNGYSPYVGITMIKQLDFKINGEIVDTITDDWIMFHDELFHNNSNRRSFAELTGGENPVIDEEVDLYVPLYLFFNREKGLMSKHSFLTSDYFYKPYFYLCACLNNDLEIEITFNDVPYFSNVSNQSNVYLSNVNLVTQEYYLTDKERSYLQLNKQYTIINTIQSGSPFVIPKNTTDIVTNLNSTLPVKSFHWAFKDVRFDDATSSTYFTNRHNYSFMENTEPNKEYEHQITDNVKFLIEGTHDLGFISEDSNNFYKYVQAYNHHFNTPRRNMYTLSFGFDPKNPLPTGSVNFSSLTPSKTKVNLKINSDTNVQSNSYNMYVYYFGYKIIQYEHGFASVIFS